MSGCDCCSQPPCPEPWIECKSISASKTKCGFTSFSGPLKYYLTSVFTISGSCTGDDGCRNLSEGGGWTETKQYTVGPTGSCSLSTTCTGSRDSSRTTYDTEICIDDSGSCIGTLAADCTWSASGSSCGSWGSAGYPAYGYTTTVTSPTTKSHTVTNFYIMSCSGSGTTTLSNEYPTVDLIAAAVASLPAYGTDWNGSCSAVRALSPDETSYTIQRFKWRIRHRPTGTCYLKVWLNEVFTPEGGGAPTVTPLTDYVWNGTGSPCLTDDTLPPDHVDNEIVGSETEVLEPSADGTTSIEIAKWSCVPGYTPPDDGTANGYPVPE